MIGLIPEALRAHAAFGPYLQQLNALSDALAEMQANASPLDRSVLSICNAVVPRFIPPPARAISAIDFERRVVEQNELIVRPNSLHDLMNALVWLTFPKTKRAISEAHVALGVNPDGKKRPRRRDVLTLFDEAGIIILSQRSDLKVLHEAHQWKQLFVEHRQEFIEETRPVLFGHGALEQLASKPHAGLTVKALWLPFVVEAPLSDIDKWLAGQVLSDACLTATESRLPLPLLGVPAWFSQNEDPRCYNDADVFRPLRNEQITTGHERDAVDINSQWLEKNARARHFSDKNCQLTPVLRGEGDSFSTAIFIGANFYDVCI